jgi:hypothetical protein
LVPLGTAVLVVLPVLWLWRGVLVGRVLFFEDVAAYFEPLWSACARSMRSGHFPTWSPEAFSGLQLLGDPQVGVLYPPHWLWMVLPPLTVYALSILAHSLLAAWGAYSLCRALGRSRVASTAASLALSLSAYFVLEARHEMFLVSAAWVPWLLRALLLDGPRAVTAIALTSAMATLGGGWSMLVYAAPVIAAFAVVRRRPLGRVAAGLSLGAGLSSVLLLPALAHAGLSPRALPLAESFAGSYAWPSLDYAVTLVLPTFYGDDALGSYRGAPDQWELCGYGIGVVGALCAMISLYRRRRVEAWIYVGLIAIAALLALGPHGPLWRLARLLPLVGRTRCPARALFVYTLVAPLLCAAGIDRLRALLPRRSRPWLWVMPIAIALELCVTFRAENPTVRLADAHVDAAVHASIPKAPTPGPWAGRAILDVHLGQAFHNGGLRWGFEVAGGYSSLPLWRYLHLLWIANHGTPLPGWPHPDLARDLSAQGLWTYASPLVDLLGVRWALLPHDRQPDGSGWTMGELGPDGVDLWKNDEALPLAHLVHRVRRVSDEREAAVAIGRDFDPRSEAIVEDDVAVAEGTPVDVSLDGAREAVRSFHLHAETAGLLVIALPWEPAWTATIDDAPVTVLRADYALLGLSVTAGDHSIVITRVDAPLRVGIGISLLSLLICLLLLVERRGALR